MNALRFVARTIHPQTTSQNARPYRLTPAAHPTKFLTTCSHVPGVYPTIPHVLVPSNPLLKSIGAKTTYPSPTFAIRNPGGLASTFKAYGRSARFTSFITG